MCWARSRAFGRSTIKPIRVVVCDTMQQGYVYYRTEPPGRNFAPEFEPQLTPQDMLELGVFGGKYLTDCRSEFPAAWLVSMVLPVLHGSPNRRRRASDSAVASDRPTRRRDPQKLPQMRSFVSPPAAASAAALGIRQPYDLSLARLRVPRATV